LKNFPKAVQGSQVEKEGKATLAMEVVCDLDHHFWHLSFGYPGVLNDINIRNISPLFSKLLAGTFPPLRPSFSTRAASFDWVYHLTVGIYPRWRVFVQTIYFPTDDAQNRFASKQEGARKRVERVFGVLFARFHILSTR
jgi:hypothetical protein